MSILTVINEKGGERQGGKRNTGRKETGGRSQEC